MESQAWQLGQPPPQVVSHTHWPQEDELVLSSHTLPMGQPPPQVVSQMQVPLNGSHTCPLVHGGHSGTQRPVVGSQVSPVAQPPHVGSTMQRPQKIDRQLCVARSQLHPDVAVQLGSSVLPTHDALSSHTSPLGQPPPQLVSHKHRPQVGELGELLQESPGAQAKPQLVSQAQMPVVGLQVSVGPQAPQQLGSATHNPKVGLHSSQAMG